MSGRFLALVPLILLATAGIWHDASGPPSPVIEDRVAAIDDPRTCQMSQIHPLEVSVRLLEPLAPNRWVTAEIVIQSDLDLGGLSLEISSIRDVEVSGRKHAEVGALRTDQQVRHTLQLRVDDTPDQRQLVVVAKGRTESGTLRRGASLNLLPQGPHHPAVASPVTSKHQRVVEYPGAARRLP